MSLNKCILQGRIPTSEKLPFAINDYTDEKKAVLRGMISVKRSYKKEGEKYYPEDLLFFKAFGATAVFIEKYFKRGDNLIIEGEVRKDEDYVKDGQTVHGQMYIHVIPQGVYFQNGNAKDDDGDSGNSAPAKAAPAPAKTNPLAKGGASGSLNPLKKGRSVL